MKLKLPDDVKNMRTLDWLGMIAFIAWPFVFIPFGVTTIAATSMALLCCSFYTFMIFEIDIGALLVLGAVVLGFFFLLNFYFTHR